MTKKVIEKKTVDSGIHKAVFNEDQILKASKDNKTVYIGSNKYRIDPLVTCNHYSRVERRTIQILMPACMDQYNRGMGGVDLLDNMVACYRMKYRKIEDKITNYLV